MSLTTLDSRTALLVVDLQEGVTGIRGAPSTTAQVLERCVAPLG